MATDQYGRPLPEGTVARLGTVRAGREGDRVSAVSFAPDGKTLASGGEDGIVRLWDTTTSKEIRRFGEHPRKVGAVAFTPDGKTLLSGSHDGIVMVWEAATGHEISGFEAPAGVLAFHPAADSKSFLAVLTDDTIRTYDLPNGTEIGQRANPFGGLSAIAFSPEGATVATGSWESMIRVCDFASGAEIKQLQGHKRSLQSLAFSADGRTVVSGSPDETIRLWELLIGKERWQWGGHKEGILAVAFSPDGKRLAAAVNDTTVLLYDVTCRPTTKTPTRVPATLMPSQLEPLWKDLASDELPQAFLTIWNIVSFAKQMVPFLKTKLKTLVPIDKQRVATILADVGHDQYGRRDKAVQDLEKIGALGEPMVKKALENPVSMDARRRLDKVLEKMQGPVPSPDTLHVLRCIEALELCNTAEARQMVEALGKEVPPTRVSLEAKASLARMMKRPVTAV